jgi:hypothetical protein
LFVSRLGIIETVSVLAKKARTGIISAADFGPVRRRFFADLRTHRPAMIRLLVRHFQEADRLLQKHSLTHALHALDALQLAVALDLQRQGIIEDMVTADRVLLAVALLEGLKTIDPEHP